MKLSVSCKPGGPAGLGFATPLDVTVTDADTGADLTRSIKRLVIIVEPGELVRTYVEFMTSTLDLEGTKCVELSPEDMAALLRRTETL